MKRTPKVIIGLTAVSLFLGASALWYLKGKHSSHLSAQANMAQLQSNYLSLSNQVASLTQKSLAATTGPVCSLPPRPPAIAARIAILETTPVPLAAESPIRHLLSNCMTQNDSNYVNTMINILEEVGLKDYVTPEELFNPQNHTFRANLVCFYNHDISHWYNGVWRTLETPFVFWTGIEENPHHLLHKAEGYDHLKAQSKLLYEKDKKAQDAVKSPVFVF